MRENIPALIDNETTHKYTKQLFKWTQTNFEQKKTGDQGLIENIYNKPLIVIFEDDRYKQEMMTSTYSSDWNETFYTVDVEVQVISGKPVRYKVLKNYAEDSFAIESN